MARFSQSNSKLFIDDAFLLEMHVFKNANKRIGACDIHNDHHDGKVNELKLSEFMNHLFRSTLMSDYLLQHMLLEKENVY